jgi:hypothetical protein
MNQGLRHLPAAGSRSRRTSLSSRGGSSLPRSFTSPPGAVLGLCLAERERFEQARGGTFLEEVKARCALELGEDRMDF